MNPLRARLVRAKALERQAADLRRQAADQRRLVFGALPENAVLATKDKGPATTYIREEGRWVSGLLGVPVGEKWLRERFVAGEVKILNEEEVFSATVAGNGTGG